MKAPDEYGINKDFTGKSTDWIATAVKRCTDAAEKNKEELSLVSESHVSSDEREQSHLLSQVRSV